MSADAAAFHDLEQCARRVYELHADLAERRTRRTIDLIFDRDRRVVIGLTGQLGARVAVANSPTIARPRLRAGRSSTGPK